MCGTQTTPCGNNSGNFDIICMVLWHIRHGGLAKVKVFGYIRLDIGVIHGGGRMKHAREKLEQQRGSPYGRLTEDYTPSAQQGDKIDYTGWREITGDGRGCRDSKV